MDQLRKGEGIQISETALHFRALLISALRNMRMTVRFTGQSEQHDFLVEGTITNVHNWSIDQGTIWTEARFGSTRLPSGDVSALSGGEYGLLMSWTRLHLRSQSRIVDARNLAKNLRLPFLSRLLVGERIPESQIGASEYEETKALYAEAGFWVDKEDRYIFLRNRPQLTDVLLGNFCEQKLRRQ